MILGIPSRSSGEGLGALGWIPGQGTKILQVAQHTRENSQDTNRNYYSSMNLVKLPE